MAAKRRPWWATSTPDEINDLNARTWRRNAEAALFRADNDPGLMGSLDSIVHDRMQSAQRDPANPGDAGERRPFDAEAYLSFRRGEQAQRPNPQPQPESNRNLLSAITDVPAGLFGGIAGGIEDVVRGGGRAISAATDVITGDRPVNDLGNTPTTQPTVQQDISAGGRQISSGANDVRAGAAETLAGGSTIVDAATGAPIRGAIMRPLDPIGGAVDAFRDPSSAPGRDLPVINRLPDSDLIAGISPRDAGGLAGEALLDIGTVSAIGRSVTGRLARKAAESAAESAARPASANKLIDLLNEAKPTRGATEALQAEARSQRAGRLAAIQAEGGGESGFRRQLGSLKGELPRQDFTPVRAQMTQADVDELINTIDSSRLRPYDKASANEALVQLLTGRLPGRSDVSKLESVFGTGFAEAILSNRSTGRKVLDAALDAAGTPKALMSSFDISYPFRQGAGLVRRKDWWRAWKPMFHALRDEQFARKFNEAAAELPADMSERAKAGFEVLDFTSTTRKGAGLTTREESFQTSLAEKIPVVGDIIRASERAFTTFGNALRRGVYESTARNWDRVGDVPAAEYRDLARWLNITTGRADLPDRVAQSDVLVLANRLFFSPRFTASRFQTLEQTARTLGAAGRAAAGKGGMRYVEREVAKDLIGFYTAGSAALATLAAAGFVKVSLDPSEADFGKGQAGSTRYDPWAGNQQAARFVMNIVQSAAERDPQKVGDLTANFVRGRLDPGIPGLTVDILTGETFLGEPVDASPDSIRGQIENRFLFLTVQDILEAAREEGFAGFLKASPSVVGIGTNTYTSSSDLQREIAAELFPDKTFDEVMGTKGFRDQVNNDPRMEQYRSEQIPDAGSPRQQVTAAMQRLQEVNTEAEAGLRQTIDAGASGERLREAIADFKRGRYANSHALISPTVESELARDNQSAADVFAERYWSATRDPDPLTGKIDYDAIEAERADILAEAQAAGVDTEYILGNGVGTYRGTRYDDPKVRAAVEDYEDFQRSLNDTGFWDIDKQTFATLQQRVDELQGFDSFEAYKDSLIDQLAQRLEDRGMDAGVAVQRAEIAVSGHSVVQAYSRMLRVGKAEWLRNNPDLASRTIADGYISPSILNIASAGQPAPMPGSSRSSSSSLGGSSILR